MTNCRFAPLLQCSLRTACTSCGSLAMTEANASSRFFKPCFSSGVVGGVTSSIDLLPNRFNETFAFVLWVFRCIGDRPCFQPIISKCLRHNHDLIWGRFGIKPFPKVFLVDNDGLAFMDLPDQFVRRCRQDRKGIKRLIRFGIPSLP